jgi:hypothetical protein
LRNRSVSMSRCPTIKGRSQWKNPHPHQTPQPAEFVTIFVNTLRRSLHQVHKCRKSSLEHTLVSLKFSDSAKNRFQSEASFVMIFHSAEKIRMLRNPTLRDLEKSVELGFCGSLRLFMPLYISRASFQKMEQYHSSEQPQNHQDLR